MLTIPHRRSRLWDTSDVDLRERLGGYEVTAVPSGRPPLALVWSVAAEDEGEEAERGLTFGVLALLDDYRITRVPGRVAS
jgi:hypothetical protein